MQFSIILAALAATAASAQYTNGTSTSSAALYPSASGTGAVKPTGSTVPFEGAASHLTGSAMGLVIAGGVALML